MAETKIPALPALPANLDPATRRALSAIMEALDIRLGRRGDKLDKAVTFRDLRDGGFTPGGVIVSSGGGGGGASTPIYQTPDAPLNFQVVGAFFNIRLSWGQPANTDSGHAYTEIWRQGLVRDAITGEWDQSNPLFSEAVMVGTAIANMYSDPVGLDTGYFYWIRHVNKNEVLGPISAGIFGSTLPSISSIIDAIGDEISQTALDQYLRDRVALIDSLDLAPLLVGGTPYTRLELIDLIATADTGILAQLNIINGSVYNSTTGLAATNLIATTASSDIVFERGRITSTADQLSFLVNIVDDPVSGLSATNLLADQATSDIIIERDRVTSVLQTTTTLSNTVNDPTTGVAATAGSLDTLSTNVSIIGDDVAAEVIRVNTLQTEVFDGAGNSRLASVEQLSSVSDTVDGLALQYSVKLDNDGYVSGFGLYNTGSSATFLVNADTFAIGQPGVPGVTPFAVQNGQVFIKSALIDNASITSAIVGNIIGDYGEFTSFLSTPSLFTPTINIGSLSKPDPLDPSTWSVSGTARNGNFSIDAAGVLHARGASFFDGNGNLIFGSGGGLDWSRVQASDGRPADNANYTTNTNQLTDGANLGGTASWSGVSGDGKPASNADVTNYSDYRVSNSESASGVLTIANPQGGHASGGSGQRGAIVVALPQSWTSTMLRFEIDVYVYASGKSFKVLVGGYNHTGANWVNAFAQIVGNTGANNRVRLGHNGSKCCVVIGIDTSVWSHAKIAVKNFQAGYSNYASSQWNTGWNVSFRESLTGYVFSADFSDALLDAKAIIGQGALATANSADWGSQVGGTGKPSDGADVTNYTAIYADSQSKADAAEAAAEAYALARANLAETNAKAWADGIVDAEETRAIADATAKADAAEAAAKAASLGRETFSFSNHLQSAVILLIPYASSGVGWGESEIFGQLTFRRGSSSSGNRTERIDIAAKTAYNTTHVSMSKTSVSWNWKTFTVTYNGLPWLALQSGSNVQDARWEFWGRRTLSPTTPLTGSYSANDQFRFIAYLEGSRVLNAEINGSLAAYSAGPLRDADGVLLINTNDAQSKADAAEAAAEIYALARANLAEINAKAWADGIVDAEETRAIADATAKANAARAAAISAASADATAKADLAATTSTWSGVSGSGKPSDGATSDLALIASSGMTLEGNTATKTGGGSAWNQQVYSTDGFTGGAYASVRIPQTNKAIMFGLSLNPTQDANYTAILVAFYFNASGTYDTRLNGSATQSFGLYAAGDVFSIAYDGVQVRYIRNGVVQRTIPAFPNLTLYFDSSFYTSSGKLANIRFGPLTSNSENVNPSNPITSSNVSTYISNLAVDTIQIQDNAMTVPTVASYNNLSRSISIPGLSKGPWTDIASFDINWGGSENIYKPAISTILSFFYLELSVSGQTGSRLFDIAWQGERLDGSGARTGYTGVSTVSLLNNGGAGFGTYNLVFIAHIPRFIAASQRFHFVMRSYGNLNYGNATGTMKITGSATLIGSKR